MYNNLKPSYEELHNACMDFAEEIERTPLKFQYVAGIARGGLLPAVVLSHRLNVPLLVIEYSSKDGEGDNKDHKNVLPQVDPQDGAILLVDDICDSGRTLNEILFHFTSSNVTVRTAVLYYKTHDKQPMIPDFIWRTIPYDAGWVIFPYERYEHLTSDTETSTGLLQSMVRN